MFWKLGTFTLTLLVAVVLAASAPGVRMQNVPPDSIYYNGDVVTLDDHFSYAHPSGSIEDYRLRKEMEKRGVLTMRITQLLSVDPRSEPG